MLLLLLILATTYNCDAGHVDQALIDAIDLGGTSEAILELPEVIQGIIASLEFQSLTGEGRVSALINALQVESQFAQAPFVAAANNLGLITDQFWASNIILVKGLNSESLANLSAMPGNFTLRPQVTFSIPPLETGPEVEVNLTQSQNPQWGVEQIRAPVAWGATRGEGIVAGIIDTGVNLKHEVLTQGYAGAWLDPYYGTCQPNDVHGHGSHCTGSMVGTNGIGVAPGAKWIACRGLNHEGGGIETAVIQCGQFMLTARPRPHVVSNSWGFGQGITIFNSVITAWRNAGIIPVFSIGNSGSGCGTANSPGDQPGVISVGATTDEDEIAYFSSRGPSTTGLRKPEVSAPGNNIVSCGTGTNNYFTLSGTSMSAPHVAGAVCLILAQTPGLTMEQVVARLSDTAACPTLSVSDRVCGVVESDGDFPNNVFGAGRIDVGRAVGL